MSHSPFEKMSPVESHRSLYLVHCYFFIINQRSSRCYNIPNVSVQRLYTNLRQIGSSILQADLGLFTDNDTTGQKKFIHTNTSPWNLGSRERSPSTKLGAAMAYSPLIRSSAKETWVSFLTLISRFFCHLNTQMFKLLYKALFDHTLNMQRPYDHQDMYQNH